MTAHRRSPRRGPAEIRVHDIRYQRLNPVLREDGGVHHGDDFACNDDADARMMTEMKGIEEGRRCLPVLFFVPDWLPGSMDSPMTRFPHHV